MTKEQGKNAIVGTDEAPSAKPKLIYEAPILIALGELARGRGQFCQDGTGNDIYCNQGASNDDCYAGSSAASACMAGTGGTTV
ncbi:MAG: hypothetical protein ACE5M4_07345 [Anaerolineales bacterium]